MQKNYNLKFRRAEDALFIEIEDLRDEESLKTVLQSDDVTRIGEFLIQESTLFLIFYRGKYENLAPVLFNILSFLKSFDYIPSYILDKDDENRWFFRIELHFVKIEDVKNLINYFFLAKYADVSLKEEIDYNYDKEAKNINIVQSNTKARRLGYFKIIIDQFNQSNYFPKNYFPRALEKIAADFEGPLVEYGKLNFGDDKGVVRVSTAGTSIKPYLELLEEFNLLTQVNNSYILTKQCKIYFYLRKYISDEENVFILDKIDKLFFLRQILVNDPLYIWSILDIIYIGSQPIDLTALKKDFVKYVLDEVERNKLFSKNNLLRQQLNEIQKRIKSWSKPLVYLEHIIEPRVNWLVDLGLLMTIKKGRSSKYNLTCEGINLIKVFLSVYGYTGNKQLVFPVFISKNYFRIFNYIYDLGGSSVDFNSHIIDGYLLDAFKIFKTEAPNRIAASQAIDYVCFKMFLEKGAIVEFDYLKDFLLRTNGNFSLDWFKTENDGALYLRK